MRDARGRATVESGVPGHHPALLACPDCELTWLGDGVKSVHTCLASGRVLKIKDLTQRPLLFPADVYHETAIQYDRRLPLGIKGTDAYDYLPAYTWPSFVRSFLNSHSSARKELGHVFCRLSDPSPEAWLTLQAVERLVSLPRFQVVADLFPKPHENWAFRVTSWCCGTAARHIGSSHPGAMWYAQCAEPPGSRCDFVCVHRPRAQSAKHAASDAPSPGYPPDFALRVATAEAAPVPEAPPAEPFIPPETAEQWKEKQSGLVNNFWSLPTQVRRRLVYASSVEADSLHKILKRVGMRGVLEWKAAQ